MITLLRRLVCGGAGLVLVSLFLPATQVVAFSPCEGARDCASGHCALGNGICCAEPCDVCGASGECLAACVGDCNGDAAVSVSELVTATRVALGVADVSACAGLPEANIATLTLASRRSLLGCPATHSLGESCVEQDNCAEGFCRDGYCCDESCAGGRCDFSGFEGVCVPQGGEE